MKSIIFSCIAHIFPTMHTKSEHDKNDETNGERSYKVVRKNGSLITIEATGGSYKGKTTTIRTMPESLAYFNNKG